MENIDNAEYYYIKNDNPKTSRQYPELLCGVQTGYEGKNNHFGIEMKSETNTRDHYLSKTEALKKYVKDIEGQNFDELDDKEKRDLSYKFSYSDICRQLYNNEDNTKIKEVEEDGKQKAARDNNGTILHIDDTLYIPENLTKINDDGTITQISSHIDKKKWQTQNCLISKHYDKNAVSKKELLNEVAKQGRNIRKDKKQSCKLLNKIGYEFADNDDIQGLGVDDLNNEYCSGLNEDPCNAKKPVCKWKDGGRRWLIKEIFDRLKLNQNEDLHDRVMEILQTIQIPNIAYDNFNTYNFDTFKDLFPPNLKQVSELVLYKARSRLRFPNDDLNELLGLVDTDDIRDYTDKKSRGTNYPIKDYPFGKCLKNTDEKKKIIIRKTIPQTTIEEYRRRRANGDELTSDEKEKLIGQIKNLTQQHNKKISELTEQNELLLAQIEKLRGELNQISSSDDNVQLLLQQQELKRIIDKKENEIYQINRELLEQQKEKEKLEDDKLQLENENNQLKQQLKELEEKLIQNQNTIDMLYTDIEQLSNNIGQDIFRRMQNDLQKLQNELDKCEAKLQQQVNIDSTSPEIVQELETKNKELEENIEQLNEQIEELKRENTKLKSERDELIQELRELKTKLQEAQEKIDELELISQQNPDGIQQSQKIERLKGKLERLNGKLEISEGRLIQQITDSDDELTKCQKELKEAKDELEKALADINTLTQNIEDKIEENLGLVEKNKKLELEKKELEETVKKSLEELQRLSQDIERLKEQSNLTDNEQLQKLERELQECEKELEITKKELESTKKTNWGKLAKKLLKTKTQIDNLKNIIRTLAHENKQLKLENENLQKRLAFAKLSLNKVKNNLEQMSKTIGLNPEQQELLDNCKKKKEEYQKELSTLKYKYLAKVYEKKEINSKILAVYKAKLSQLEEKIEQLENETSLINKDTSLRLERICKKLEEPRYNQQIEDNKDIIRFSIFRQIFTENLLSSNNVNSQIFHMLKLIIHNVWDNIDNETWFEDKEEKLNELRQHLKPPLSKDTFKQINDEMMQRIFRYLPDQNYFKILDIFQKKFVDKFNHYYENKGVLYEKGLKALEKIFRSLGLEDDYKKLIKLIDDKFIKKYDFHKYDLEKDSDIQIEDKNEKYPCFIYLNHYIYAFIEKYIDEYDFETMYKYLRNVD